MAWLSLRHFQFNNNNNNNNNNKNNNNNNNNNKRNNNNNSFCRTNLSVCLGPSLYRVSNAEFSYWPAWQAVEREWGKSKWARSSRVCSRASCARLFPFPPLRTPATQAILLPNCFSFSWTDRMGVTTGLLFLPVFLIIGELFQEGATQPCPGRTEYSTLWMMLQRHIFKTINVSSGFECLQECHQEITCQSFNYVISQSACELNDRTKEARPVDFVPNTHRYYFTRYRNRGEI